MQEGRYKGNPYFYIDMYGNIVKARDTFGEMEDKLYNAGNYFKTRLNVYESDLYNSYIRGSKKAADKAYNEQKIYDTGRGGTYYYIDSYGNIKTDEDEQIEKDCKRRSAGNYFRTEAEAKHSKLYRMFFEGE